MDSYHENVINFGREEANRMAATAPDPWKDAEAWLRSTTGQEFCDELVWGTVGTETLDGLLRQFGANINTKNRQKLMSLADKVMQDAD